MSIENIQGSGSLVPFDKKGSHTLELRKEAQVTHELSMQVFQEMQGVITRLQEQNTCLKVALIKANGRESTTEIVHQEEVRSLREAKELAEKSVAKMREEMATSMRLTDERVKKAINEKIEALEAAKKVYEKRILEMKEVCEERVKAAEERGKSQIKAACAPLELKLKSLVMEIELMDAEALKNHRSNNDYYYSHPRESGVFTYGCLAARYLSFSKNLKELLVKIKD